MNTQEQPFWKVPCNPITGFKTCKSDIYGWGKNEYNKKYYKEKSKQ